jgi:hypothetical protein
VRTKKKCGPEKGHIIFMVKNGKVKKKRYHLFKGTANEKWEQDAIIS